MNQNTPYDRKNPRIEGLIGEGIVLSEKKVTIIGLGGGSEIALHLLRTGISKMDLYDHDVLEKGNLIRHICGSSSIGKNKAHAVKFLLDEYRGIEDENIRSFGTDIFKDYQNFQESIESSDCVMVATDNEASKFFVNEKCQNIYGIEIRIY